MLHSGFCTWVEWRRTIGLLEAEREVLAPTLPGGLGGPGLDVRERTMLAAQADYVEGLLDEIGWDDPVPVAGSSFGGVLGVELANRGRASRVLALAPPWVAPGRGLAFYMTRFSPILTFRAAEPLFRFTSRSPRFLGLFFGHAPGQVPELDPADAAELWRSMSRFPLVEVGRRSPFGGPGMPDLEAVDTPLTLFWGTRDIWVPRWMRERWQAGLPEAEIVELEGHPHQPHLRDPKRVTREILARTQVI